MHLKYDFKGGITEFSTSNYTRRRDDYSSRYQINARYYNEEKNSNLLSTSHDDLIIVDHRTYILLSLMLHYHSLPLLSTL